MARSLEQARREGRADPDEVLGRVDAVDELVAGRPDDRGGRRGRGGRRRTIFRAADDDASRGRDPRLEHELDPDRVARGRHRPARPRDRHALLQPGAGAEARRGDPRRETSDETAAAIVALARELGKEPVEAQRRPRLRLEPDPDAVHQRGGLRAAEGVAEAGGDRHGREARLRAPDRPARARRPDRPRHAASRSWRCCTRGSATRSTRRARCCASTSQAGRLGRKSGQGFYVRTERTELTRTAVAALKARPRFAADRRATASSRGGIDAACLLVDDDAGLRALLRTTFELVDVEVDEAGERAARPRARSRAASPDVIVLDVAHARARTGSTLCRRAEGATRRRARSRSSSCPARRRRRGAPPRRGADAFLPKPFSPLAAPRRRRAARRRARPGSARRRRPSRRRRRAAPALRARPAPPARDRARPARAARRAPTARRSTALAGRSSRRTSGTRAHSQRVAALRARAHACGRAGAARRPQRRVRLPAPRRRQDRHPRRDPAEARPADDDGAPR